MPPDVLEVKWYKYCRPPAIDGESVGGRAAGATRSRAHLGRAVQRCSVWCASAWSPSFTFPPPYSFCLLTSLTVSILVRLSARTYTHVEDDLRGCAGVDVGRVSACWRIFRVLASVEAEQLQSAVNDTGTTFRGAVNGIPRLLTSVQALAALWRSHGRAFFLFFFPVHPVLYFQDKKYALTFFGKEAPKHPRSLQRGISVDDVPYFGQQATAL